MELHLGKHRIHILSITGVVLFLAIWIGLYLVLGSIRLPSPWRVFRVMYKQFLHSRELMVQGGGNHGMAPHILYTIRAYLSGAAVGVIFGIGFGLLMGWSQRVRDLLEPPLEVIRTVPQLAAIPFLIMWFGTGIISQFILIAGYCFTMLAVNTVEAIRNVSPVYLQFAATMGATRSQIYRKVVLPAIIPELVGGLRVALAFSWGLEVVAELVGVSYGIGKTMMLFVPLVMTDAIIAGIIWVVLLAILVDALFVRAVRRITVWVPVIE